MKLSPAKLKQERLQMIIREFAFSFARHTGVEPTPEQRRAVEVDICGQFGGESYYVPLQRKAQHQASVAKALKQGRKTQEELARSIGITARGLRKAINGK